MRAGRGSQPGCCRAGPVVHDARGAGLGDTGAVERRAHDGGAGFQGHDWDEAYREMSVLAATQRLDADGLDRFATVAYLTGRDDEATRLWTEAHQEAAGRDDVAGAARFGLRLAEAFGFKGDLARGAGWVERVRRMLDEAATDCVERGYLLHASAMCRIFEAGDFTGAHHLFVQAGKIGARFRDRELVTLARIGEGRMLVYLGDLREGLALLDEAMVSVEAREIPPRATGDAYCTVIDACHELFDLARCRVWTASFSRWCEEQRGLVLYRGHCLLHRAEVMQREGRWSEAAGEARRACERLADPVHRGALGASFYQEAEVRRLRGDLDGAEDAYRSANEHGCDPQPGFALLRLAQGRTDVAEATIRRVLAETDGPIARARVLGPFVQIVLAAGDVAGARAAARELGEIASELGSPYLRALADHADGAVTLADGDARRALGPLRRALQQWSELETPYEAAQTRALVADACAEVGDTDGADLARSAARSALDGLGAGGDAARAARGGAAPAPGGLTGREVEVLRLLAAGKTNRVIGAELFISEKTVASHVSHIFTKLGVSSRSAATAYAYANDLVSGLA